MWKWLKRGSPSEHEWATQQLSVYLDDELSPPDRARVEAHLKECRTCVEELSTLRWTVNLTAQLPMLRAPRSFLITEAIAQPRRAPLGLAYVYLRGATVAVAAVLLLVLAGDLLWPYSLSPAVPAAQVAMRKALPAVEAVPLEREVVKEIPVEKEVITEEPVATVVVEKELVVEKETVREVPVEKVVEKEVAVDKVVEREAVVEQEVVKKVEVEKEVEKPALAMAPERVVEKEAAEVQAVTPTPAEEAAKMDLEAKQVAPAAERTSKEEVEQEPVILGTPSAERAPEPTLGPVGSGGAGEQEVPVGERAVATAVVPPTPTSEKAIPTSTPPPPHRVAEKAAPSLQPTPLPPVAPVAEVTEPTRRPLPPWRSALRLTEMGLGLLMILLAGSALVIRLRHR